MKQLPNHNTSFVQDVVAGLAVSFVALSLGGAFGLLSGRGVLVGMLSACLFPIVTSLLGGTRVQCSGPTGPMTSVFIAFASSTAVASLPAELHAVLFDLTIFLAGILLILAGLLRLGHFVRLVPNLVISGFMCGIALIIWISQIRQLLHIDPTGSSLSLNVTIAAATFILASIVKWFAGTLPPRWAGLCSGVLVALVVMTAVCHLFALPVAFVSDSLTIESVTDITTLFQVNHLADWPWQHTLLALYWAAQLAAVAYLDTLMTAVILDKQTNEVSQKNKELGAQGLATLLVAFIGGLPGAQATERSVMLKQEGASTRLAGVLIGVFGLLIIFFFQGTIVLIPKAVFAGILFKVGFDVFDWQPFILYVQALRGKTAGVHVGHLPIIVIIVTALLAAVVNLLISVLLCTAVYLFLKRKLPIADLCNSLYTEGLSDES